MSHTIPLPCVLTLMRSCAAQLEDLRAALQLPPPFADIACALRSGPASRLLQVAGNLPASVHPHVDEHDYLVRRSLRAAASCVRGYRERYPEPPAAGDDRAAWQQRLCAIGLAGLVSDLGTLWSIDVHAGAQRWPIHRDLVDWSQAIAAADATVTCLHVSARTAVQSRHPSARPPSLYFLSRIVTPPLLAACRWRSANDVLTTLCRAATGAPRGDLLMLLDETHLRGRAVQPRPEGWHRDTAPRGPSLPHGAARASGGAQADRAEVPRVADQGTAPVPEPQGPSQLVPEVHAPPDQALSALVHTCLGYLRDSPFRLTVPPPMRNGPHPTRSADPSAPPRPPSPQSPQSPG